MCYVWLTKNTPLLVQWIISTQIKCTTLKYKVMCDFNWLMQTLFMIVGISSVHTHIMKSYLSQSDFSSQLKSSTQWIFCTSKNIYRGRATSHNLCFSLLWLFFELLWAVPEFAGSLVTPFLFSIGIHLCKERGYQLSICIHQKWPIYHYRLLPSQSKNLTYRYNFNMSQMF